MTSRVKILLDHTPFPGAGEELGGHKVIESVMDVAGRNWEIHFKGNLSKKQVKEAVSDLTLSPFALPVEDEFSIVEFRAKGMSHVRTNPPGNATVVRGHMYYARPNPISSSEFHAEMDEMLIDDPEKHFTKHNAPTDAELKKKLWSFVTMTGESYGWYKGKSIYHRRASIIMPKIKINKALEGATMFYHTHPAKDEPSLTSADDIQFYLDLHFAWGIKTFYTVMKHKMDKFTITAKPGGKEKYLRMEEEAFVSAVDGLIGEGEKRAEKEVGKDAPETDYQNAVTAEMVRLFNKKYSSIATISFRPSVKKTNAAAAAAKEKPRYLWGARSNPGPNPPIKPEQKYMASALNELKGLDYAFEHYGGDEYAHTMYVYWWMQHHFMPTPQFPSGRLFKLQQHGLDSEARSQLRGYLSTTIHGNWTYLDAMLIIGLYHDISKLREKEPGAKPPHTIASEMFIQEVQAELNLPSQMAEDIAHVLSTDVGRKGISDEEFRMQVGDYYGVSKLMQMADVYTHHPFMYSGRAKKAKEEGAIEYSDGQLYKDYAMTELTDDLKEFLDSYARPNPPPVPVYIKWGGQYNRGNFDMDIVQENLGEFDQRVVPDEDGKTKPPESRYQGGSGGHLYYMRFNQTHVSSIPENRVIAASLALRTGKLQIDIARPPEDVGREIAQGIYELVGSELQASYPDIEVEEVEPEPTVNPRKAARIQVITICGPSGVGKSTVQKFLLKNIPDAAMPPTYTTRPRRPDDGITKRYMTKEAFREGIKKGEFVEWYQAGSGHFYGRKLSDFIGSYAIVDVTLGGMESYRKHFPNTYSVFLAPDPKVTVEERAKKLYKRGGISKAEAMKRAKIGAQLVKDAAKYKFDLKVTMYDGKYREGAQKILDSIPRNNPERVVPWRRITEEDAARVAAIRQAKYIREANAWNDETAKLIDSPNWMAIEGTTPELDAYPKSRKAPGWYNAAQGNDRKYGVVMKKHAATLFDYEGSNPIVEVPPVLGGDEENAPTVDDEPLANPPISELMSEADRYYVDQVKKLVKLVSPFYMDNDGRIMGVFEVPVVIKRDDGKVANIGTTRLLFYTRTGEGTDEESAQLILDHPDTTNYDLIAESPSFARYGLGDGNWDSLMWANMIGSNAGRGYNMHSTWYIKPSSYTYFDEGPTIPPFPAPRITWERKFSKRFGHRTMYYAGLAIRELYPDKDALTDLALTVPQLLNRYKLSGIERSAGYAINCFLDEHGAVRGKYALLPPSYTSRPTPPIPGSLQAQGSRTNPGKELFEWFTEWVHLINMKNKELEAFLDSPLGKKAGLSKEEAQEQGIKSGRVSGRRILKMRAKLGLTGPKDYIKLGPRIIEDYYEKALKEWTGPSDDPIKGETDWDWCKRQVRFVKRHGAFPYNADQKGPLVREQKTQNQVSRRLLGLWVWGHDPWRWARKHDITRMPPCPDVPWIGMTEKRKYGKVTVKMNGRGRRQYSNTVCPSPQKQKYASPADAEYARSRNPNFHMLRVYRCPVDGTPHWHLTSSIRRNPAILAGDVPDVEVEKRFLEAERKYPVALGPSGRRLLGGGKRLMLEAAEEAGMDLFDYELGLSSAELEPYHAFQYEYVITEDWSSSGLSPKQVVAYAHVSNQAESRELKLILLGVADIARGKGYADALFNAINQDYPFHRVTLRRGSEGAAIPLTMEFGIPFSAISDERLLKYYESRGFRGTERADMVAFANPTHDSFAEDWVYEQPNPPEIAMFPGEMPQGPAALYQQTVSITQLSNPRSPAGHKFPARYLKGLTPLEKMIAEDEIDKGHEYDPDDPEAYKFWKSDIKAKARGLKIGPSKHKEEYYRRYRKNIDPDYKPSGDSPKARFINRIVKETKIKKSIITKVYDKGLAAWRIGHRPGVQQHQWAAARVYAFAVGADSSTGKGKPDHSLAVEAGVRKE